MPAHHTKVYPNDNIKFWILMWQKMWNFGMAVALAAPYANIRLTDSDFACCFIVLTVLLAPLRRKLPCSSAAFLQS